MTKFKNISIQKKLTIIQVVTAFVAVLICCVFFVYNDIKIFGEASVQNKRVVAEILGFNAASILEFNDRESANKMLLQLKGIPSVLNAVILDKEGKEFARYDKPGEKAFSFPSPTEHEQETRQGFGQSFLVSYKITYKSFLGTVMLRSEISGFRDVILSYIKIAVLILLGSLVAAVFISTLLQRSITTRLLSLVHKTKEVTKTGNYSIRVSGEGQDEIGVLSGAFNNMLDQIEKTKKELDETNAGLEEQVQQRTAELKEYQHFFNNNNDLCAIVNMEGYFEIFNAQFIKTLGYSENEICEKPFIEFLHPDDLAASQAGYHQQKSEGNEVSNFVNRLRKKDGSYVTLEWSATPDTVLGKIYAVGRDITDRKKAEEALLNSEEKFRNLMNFSPVGITLSSQQGEILETNQAIIDMMGFASKEEFLNTPASELYVDQNGRTQLVELFKKEGVVKNFEVRLKRKNGEVIWCSSHIHPFKLPGGEMALLSTTLDITERKKMEDALKLTQFAVDNFGDAIFWITPDARIVKVNDAACSMLGYSQAELLQFSIPDIDPNYNAELWPNHFAELRQKGSLFFETYQQGKDGQLIPVEVTANYINFDNKEFNCASVRNISQRKKAEEQLQAVNKELESFSYSVSHDLRAPLRAINGFAKILYEDYASKLDAEGIGTLNLIRDNSKKMGELIDALLAFSKLGRRELSVSEINMTELVATVREEEMRGHSDKTEFIINELPAAKGDIVLIKQVWINLVSNAIKYSKHVPKAKIEIGSYYKDNLIVYYVKDNGAGFDMQYYDKLFGVFQRLHSQEEFKGTGIGLSIVEKVINRHGGSVWAESKLNEGSCFYFSLPKINL